MSIILSIITVTYNDYDGLKHTVESIDYSLSEIEHIVVDGASSDMTKAYLEQLTQPINWTSENDHGIYDAMNKGLKKASGSYVIFMNSGDKFYEVSTLSALVETLKTKNPDILYGETMLINQEGKILGTRSDCTTRRLPNPLTVKAMKGGMMVCHQSFIVRKEIAPSYKHNNLSADIDWVIKCLKSAESILCFNQPIAQFLTGGISDQRKFKSLKDRFKILSTHFGLWSAIISHLKIVMRYLQFKISTF